MGKAKMTTVRITKKRTLEKQGFAHVAGWIQKDQAAAIMEQIKAALADVEKAAKNDRS